MKFAVIALALIASAICVPVGYQVTEATGYTVINTSQKSTLYQVETAVQNPYNWPIYLADLHGSRYAMGYDYGIFFGGSINALYWKFLKNIIGTTWSDEALELIIGPALDWQWDTYLSAELPQEYKEEIAGIAAGGASIGVQDLDKYFSRVVVLANLPGDPQDLIYIFIKEWNSGLYEEIAAKRKKNIEPILGMQCSMFGIWGSRTINGDLFSARNLDWNKDTGIAQYKVVTVFHPEDGGFVHATVGFAPLWGALTGMSSKGITVHEANLEEDQITFGGFPWVLRLRYVMENAANLAEAYLLWEHTNNTVGFNHMIGSGADAKSMVEETMSGYTAYFLDDDPREAAATFNQSGTLVQLGFPLKEAVYRTNHGYDPKIRENYEWNQSPSSWSMTRYMMFYNGFNYYSDAGIQLGELEAVNMTAIVGDKSSQHPYLCLNNTDGSNVLSATYHPSANIMYVAWEDGTGNTWRPACCSTYVKFDMTQFWNSS